jgi:hypothetical protein
MTLSNQQLLDIYLRFRTIQERMTALHPQQRSSVVVNLWHCRHPHVHTPPNDKNRENDLCRMS